MQLSCVNFLFLLSVRPNHVRIYVLHTSADAAVNTGCYCVPLHCSVVHRLCV